MPRPLRYVPEEAKTWTDSYGRKVAVVEVTIRAYQSRYLFRPSPEIRDVIVGVMAHVQKRVKFDIYGYAFLSNHGSYLIGVTDAEHQGAIMRDVHSKISTELKREELSDWTGGVLGQRGRPILVAGEDDLVARLKYCLANSTKEHLVTRPDRWGGAHAAKALMGCGNGVHGRFLEDQGVYIDRTLLDALKHKPIPKAQALKMCSKPVTLRLSKLPCWAEMSDEAYRQEMVALCRNISDEAARVRRDENRSVLGMARVLRYHAHHRPEKTANSPAPMLHCCCPTFRAFFKEAYRAFSDAYRQAMSALHKKLGPVFFPDGGIPPGYTYLVDRR